MSTQVVIRQTADSNVREYHSSEELTETPYSQILDTEMSSQSNLARLGQATTLLKFMSGTKGINKVTLRPHSIKVTKTASSDWSQVEPIILRAFEETFGSSEVSYYSKATRQKVLA